VSLVVLRRYCAACGEASCARLRACGTDMPVVGASSLCVRSPCPLVRRRRDTCCPVGCEQVQACTAPLCRRPAPSAGLTLGPGATGLGAGRPGRQAHRHVRYAPAQHRAAPDRVPGGAGADARRAERRLAHAAWAVLRARGRAGSAAVAPQRCHGAGRGAGPGVRVVTQQRTRKTWGAAGTSAGRLGRVADGRSAVTVVASILQQLLMGPGGVSASVRASWSSSCGVPRDTRRASAASRATGMAARRCPLGCCW